MRRFLVRWLIWHFAVWLVIATLLAPILPAGWLLAAMLPFLAAAPVLVLIRRFRSLGSSDRPYPGRAMRLLLLRPFWYLQVAGPFLAAAGSAGALVGLLFGEPGTGGRAALALAGALALIVGVAG